MKKTLFASAGLLAVLGLASAQAADTARPKKVNNGVNRHAEHGSSLGSARPLPWISNVGMLDLFSPAPRSGLGAHGNDALLIN